MQADVPKEAEMFLFKNIVERTKIIMNSVWSADKCVITSMCGGTP